MGVAFSLASFTCVVGVIGPILAGTSSTVAAATVSMFAYSVGFALPFFLLALFPMLLSSMPQAGGWMNALKVMLGFFEVCFAGYYLWRLDLALDWGIGTYPIILSLWVVTIFLAGLYLLGKIRLPHDAPLEALPVPRLVLAIVFFAFGLFLFAGLMEKADLGSSLRGLLPPKPPPAIPMVAALPAAGGGGTGANASADREFHVGFGGVPWTTDYEHGLATGKKLGRRILLNFTGIFCTNCREMETGMLPRPEVREELEELVLVELWTDIPSDDVGRKYRTHTTKEMSEQYQKLRNETYRNAANPYYVLLSPDGKVLADIGYTRDVDEFLGFLKTGK
jgi:thiol:disulfide interchange protein DsbD